MVLNHASGRLRAAAEEAASGAFHLFWGGSLATVLSAVCSILIARLLGPEHYGIYTLSLVVSSFLMLFTDYGVSQALTRFISLYRSKGEPHHITPLLKTGLAFNTATGLLMLFIGFILAEPLTSLLISRSEMASLVRMTMILVLIQPLSVAAGCALLGFGDMKGYAIIDVVRQAFRATISPLLIVLGFSVAGAVAGYIVAFAAGLAISLTLIYNHYRQIKNSKSKSDNDPGKVLHSMVAYGIPLYLSSTLNSFATTLRSIILAYFTTNFLIGNFNTAMNFAVLITLLSTPVASVLFPAFSKLSISDGEAKTMFTYSVKYTAALIIPASVFVAAMSRDLIFIIYGTSYSSAPLYLSLHAVTFMFAALGSTVLGSFFSGIGDSKVNLKATLFSTGIFIPSAIALTSTLQVEGFLIAMILATAASTLYSLTVAIRKYNLRIDLKSSSGICLAALLAAAPTIPLTYHPLTPRIINLASAFLLHVIAYLTLVPLFKTLTIEDFKSLNSMFSKVTVLRPLVRLVVGYENKILRRLDCEKEP